MSEKWPAIPLRDILIPASRSVLVEPSKTYQLLGARWYAKGLYIKNCLPGSEIRAKKVYLVEKNDFVYNRLFAWKGSFAIATSENAGCYVSNEFPCFEVRLDRAIPSFLGWHFRQNSVWQKALGLSAGATSISRNRFKEDNFLALELPLPPLDEQRRVAESLDAIATEVEKARALQRRTLEEARSLVISLHLKLSGERVVALGKVLQLDEDQVAVQPGAEYTQVGVRGFGGGLFEKAPIDGASTTYRAFNKLYAGGVVLSQVKGWEGAIAVCSDALSGKYVSPEYRTFRCVGSEVLPGYLEAIIGTPWFWERLHVATRGVGARRERTRPEQFLKIQIPMPTLDQQRGAVAIFDHIRTIGNLKKNHEARFDSLIESALNKSLGFRRVGTPVRYTGGALS